MLTTQTLLDGVFQPQDITLTLTAADGVVVPENLRHEVEIIWSAAVREAASKGLALWDSQSYRLLRCHQDNNGVAIEIGSISYKDNFGMSKLIRDGVLGETHAPQLMYNSVILRTSDNRYLFGGGGPYHRWQGETKCIGGSYNASEHVLVTSADLFVHALHEVEEETGIGAPEVTNLVLRKLFRTTRGLAAFIFTADVSLTSEQARARFATVEHKEFAELLCLTAREARAFFTEKGRHFLEITDLIND